MGSRLSEEKIREIANLLRTLICDEYLIGNSGVGTSKVRQWQEIELPFADLAASPIVAGIDPGSVNMGIAVIKPRLTTKEGDRATLYQIWVDRGLNSPDRITAICDLVKKILLPIPIPTIPYPAVVEGASYGSKRVKGKSTQVFGQVALANARAAAVLGLSQSGFNPHIVPPRSIRKGVFGNGTIRAQEIWPDLPGDAVTALACALYALFTRRETAK